MSRHDSTGSFQGFSISQPALGAALQFYPALGSAELDALINAYVPGVASVKEKRTQVTMEFFRHAELTGEFVKFFPLFTFDSLVADSPASSGFYDSGYGSSFHASPVVPDLTWAQPAQFVPSSQASVASSQSRRPSGERKTSSVAKGTTHDFSHLPGMKILTKDGVDVTNSASRGCKTKEQRDHAHLMRIIKACDSCKKKKIRCDPSHKKRSASQASSPEAKPAKKSKKAAPRPTPQKSQQVSPADSSDFFAGVSPLDLDIAAPLAPDTDLVGDLEQDWEQFFHYADAPVAIPTYDFSLDPASYLSSPSSGSSDLSPQPFTPSTDTSSNTHLRDLEFQQPTLPYLSTTTHGSNYIDFSLYDSQPPFSAIDASEPGWSPHASGVDLGSSAWCRHDSISQPGTDLSTRPPMSAAGHNSHTSTMALSSGSSLATMQATAIGRVRACNAGPAGHTASDRNTVNSHANGNAVNSAACSTDQLGRPDFVSASRSPCLSNDSRISSCAPLAAMSSVSDLQTPQTDPWGDGWHHQDRQLSTTAADRSQRGHATADGLGRLDQGDLIKANRAPSSDKRTTDLAFKQQSALAIATGSQSGSRLVALLLALTGSKSSVTEQPSTTTALINRKPSSTGSQRDQRETQEYWATNAPLAAMANQQRQHDTLASCSQGLAVDNSAVTSRDVKSCSVAGAFLATMLLLTLPFRHSVEGPSRMNSSWSLFVGLGLISIISSVILHASSSEPFQKLAIIPLSLVLVLQHLTPKPSDAVPHKPSFKGAIDNVKSKMQDVSRMFAVI